MGTADGDDDLRGQLAVELDLVVESVDDRLAPEHPFPAGLDDCVAALDWLAATADELGVGRDRLVVGGASAGGRLAAGVAQVAHDRGGPALRLQLQVDAMLDDRTPPRADAPTSTLVWSPASNRFVWTQDLGHPPAVRDDRPDASAARRDDLPGLAPAWIGVGDIDLFHDEDVAYARRLPAPPVGRSASTSCPACATQPTSRRPARPRCRTSGGACSTRSARRWPPPDPAPVAQPPTTTVSTSNPASSPHRTVTRSQRSTAACSPGTWSRVRPATPP